MNNCNNNNLYFKIINNKLLKKDIYKYVFLNCDWRIKYISKNEEFNKLKCDSTFKHLLVQDFNSIEELEKFIKELESTISLNISSGKINSGSNNIKSLIFNKCKISVKLSKFSIKSTIRNLELGDGLMIELEEGAPIFKKLFGNKNLIKSTSLFSNLTSLDLGKNNEHVLQGGYLENANNLKKLTLSHTFTAHIGQRMLPNQIETLIFKSGYSFDIINYPSSLKELSFIGNPNYVVGFNFKILNSIPSSLESIIFEYCDTMDLLSIRKLVNSLRKLSITHNKIYLSTFNILLNSLYINNDHYFQDKNIPDIINTSSTPLYPVPAPQRITLSDRLSIPKPKLESLSIKVKGGPLQQTNPDLLPHTLTELSLPINLLVWVTGVKRGYPGSLKSFEGTLSHLSTKFEFPNNITSLSTIITTEYTSHNVNTPSFNSFNTNFQTKNDIDYNSINIDNNNQLINQFINLKSLKLYIMETSLLSLIPTSINNLEISKFEMLYYSNTQVNQSFDQSTFNFNLLNLINLKSLKLDDLFTNLLIEKLNSNSNSALISETPFPSSVLLLDLSFNSRSSNFKLSQSFFNSIKFLIVRGDSKPNISSLPLYLELLFIQDSNPVLNDPLFLSNYSSIIRTFNNIDQNIIYNNLKDKINNIY